MLYERGAGGGVEAVTKPRHGGCGDAAGDEAVELRIGDAALPGDARQSGAGTTFTG